MMKLIIEQNVHIGQMDVEMDKMTKENEQSQRVSIVILDSIPITQISTTRRKIVVTSSTKTTSAEQVTKTLENMSIQS